jgi:methionyl-tRNA formyltransferase
MSPFPLRVVFAGTPAFAVPALDALGAAGHDILAVYTQPDRPAGRGRKLAASAVKERALARGLAVEQPQSMKSDEVVLRLRTLAPDVMIVVAYGLMLPQAVLDIPRLGCFNIHASLLPRWRGAAPIQHAILAGDRSTGITIMRMTAGLDAGPIVAQQELAISEAMSARELHDALAAMGAPLVVESLQAIAAGRAVMREQNAREATHAPRISRADARIRWSEPAQLIARRVRAYDPWPVAETVWRNEQLRIWRAVERAGRAGSAPGEVLSADAGGIEIACGEGSLALLTLQMPGRKPVAAADFLHAHSMIGDRLN